MDHFWIIWNSRILQRWAKYFAEIFTEVTKAKHMQNYILIIIQLGIICSKFIEANENHQISRLAFKCAKSGRYIMLNNFTNLYK